MPNAMSYKRTRNREAKGFTVTLMHTKRPQAAFGCGIHGNLIAIMLE